MTIYDRPPPLWGSPTPVACLALLLAMAIGLMLLPARLSEQARGIAQASLRPGLAVIARSRETWHGSLRWLGNLGSSSAVSTQLEREIQELREQNGRLQAEIAWLRSQAPAEQAVDAAAISTSPLVRPRLVEARVLGRQAQSFLKRQGLIDAGSSSGIAQGDLVLDPPALIDQGAATELSPGQFVLSGNRVWGKVLQVQPRLSTILRVTDSGYRDLVRIAGEDGAVTRPGARGVLEGTGEPLCRLRLVSVTQAVAVGQSVISEGSEGVLSGALLYGRIERVEQLPGVAHWEIWVRPAFAEQRPTRVAVLTAEMGSIADGRASTPAARSSRDAGPGGAPHSSTRR